MLIKNRGKIQIQGKKIINQFLKNKIKIRNYNNPK